jgi:hypothetical protein
MTHYLYNALDIAAYFKWTTLPSETERAYMERIFDLRDSLLALPLAKEMSIFSQAVYREMYHLWARGFENEFSDVSRIATPGAISIFCEQKYLALESYMKLISLHLILSNNLPYIRINFSGLPLLTGVEGDFRDFESNVALAAEALRLSIADIQGREIDPSEGLPTDTSRIRLSDDFRKELFGCKRYREQTNNHYLEKMQLLQEASRVDHEKHEVLLEETVKRAKRTTLTRPPKDLPPIGEPDKEGHKQMSAASLNRKKIDKKR